MLHSPPTAIRVGREGPAPRAAVQGGEQAYLANYAMRNEIFRGIVNSKTFTSINYVPLKRCQKMPHYDFNTWQLFDERDIPFIHGGVPYV